MLTLDGQAALRSDVACRTLAPVLNSLQNSFLRRDAHRFKPTADIDLSMGFATKMPGGWTCGSGQIPLDDREILISAFDHKPMDRILADDPANLASEFLNTQNGFSVERGLRKVV